MTREPRERCRARDICNIHRCGRSSFEAMTPNLILEENRQHVLAAGRCRCSRLTLERPLMVIITAIFERRATLCRVGQISPDFCLIYGWRQACAKLAEVGRLSAKTPVLGEGLMAGGTMRPATVKPTSDPVFVSNLLDFTTMLAECSLKRAFT